MLVLTVFPACLLVGHEATSCLQACSCRTMHGEASHIRCSRGAASPHPRSSGCWQWPSVCTMACCRYQPCSIGSAGCSMLVLIMVGLRDIHLKHFYRWQGCDILRKEGEDISARCIVGSALWLTGWIINLQSDHILRNLRKPGQTGKLRVLRMDGRLVA